MFDSAGDLFVANESSSTVKEFSPSGIRISAGSSTSVTITAEDQYNNIVTGFSDSVTLSDSLGGASFSVNPVVSFSGGTASLTATLDTAGTQSITATDPTATITGTSSPITVTPAAASTVIISASPTSAVAVGSEFQVNTYTTGNQLGSKVASDAAGDYVITWTDYSGEDGSANGIFAQRYNAAGVTQGSEFQVNTYTTGNQSGAAVAMDSAGDFVIAWVSTGQDGNDLGIFAQRYTSTGSAWGSEFQVNTYTTGAQEVVSAAMDSAGDFVIAWTSAGQDGSSLGIYAQRYASTGSALGSEFQVNTYTTGGQDAASVAMDSAGDFVIAWNSLGEDGSDYGIFAQRYASTGAALGSEFQVNTYTTGYQKFPVAAMDSAGDFVIAWTDYNGEDGSGKGIFAQRYNSSGVAQGSEFRVNTYTTGDQEDASIAMDSAGDFVIAWTDYSGEDGSGYGVYAQQYSAAGTALGSEFRVNTYTTSNQVFPSVKMDSAGDFVIAWQSGYFSSSQPTQDGSDYGVYAQRYDAQTVLTAGSTTSVRITVHDQFGNAVTGDTITLSDSLGGETFTTGAFSAAGVATFTATLDKAGTQTLTAADTSATISGSSGPITVTPAAASKLVVSAGVVVAGSEFLVNSYTTGYHDDPKVASDAAGDYVIAWQIDGQDGSGYGIFAQRYNSSGVPQGSEFQVNTYTTSYQGADYGNSLSVAMDAAGDFVIAWQSYTQDGSNYGIYAQRYNASGVPQGSEFKVNTYTTGSQAAPTVAMDSAGDFVVAWESVGEDGSGYGIYAQRYNSSGVTQGSEFQVNTYTTSDQDLPAAAMDSTGDFVIIWESKGQDGSGYGIFAQRYNSSGMAQGSEFRVNTYTTGNQGFYYEGAPAVAMDSAGDFSIAWESYGQDGSNYGIFSQRYNSSGAAQGSEFQVNTYTTGIQNLPAAAMDSAGDLVIIWASDGQDGSGYGIFAQRYNSSGVAQGSEFQVNTYTTGNQGYYYGGEPSVAMDSAGDFLIAWDSYGENGLDYSYGIYAKRYTAPPTKFSAGGTTNVVVTAEDQFGNVATGFSDSVTLSDNLGGASFSALSFSGGVATATATLDKAGADHHGHGYVAWHRQRRHIECPHRHVGRGQQASGLCVIGKFDRRRHEQRYHHSRRSIQ